MSGVSPIRPGPSPILEEALHRRTLLARAQTGGRRALINLVLAALCLVDANHMLLLKLITSHPAYLATLVIYLLEMAAFAVLLTSSLSSLWSYISPLHSSSPLALTAEQFRLLRLHPSSPGFTKSPEVKTPVYPNPFTPLPGPLVSPLSSPPSQSPTSPTGSNTPVNMSRHSWHSNSPSSPCTPPTSTNLRSPHFPRVPSSPLTDTSQLASYLSSYSQWEASQSMLAEPDTASQASQSTLFWQGTGLTHSNSKLDFSPASNSPRPLYQLSSPLPPSLTQDKDTSKDTTKDQTNSKVLSHRLGIDPMELVSWNENLRVWLTQTLLRPLVSEVDRVNSTLPRLGVADCSVGTVPLDRLRKVATLPQVMSSLPSLPTLLPYLSVSTDQTYLVARLRDLAKTGAMSKYKWSSGGDGWTDRLPSDSELVLHCIATYMDSRLLTSTATRMGEGGETITPFTGVHFFKHGEKVRKEDKESLALVQLGRSPTHYVVQVGGRQLDVGGGRNNMVHSLLLFLHTVKGERGGMLGRVNLGLSGLNILWVLD
eukprot:GFUD01009951.1.p1 GENE.GFUD01009951.1~~GFUD01009951.1.p1  ORF type:complete len:540 (+),score=208.25 GFUD01009951.1:58-1677(+)